MKPELNKLDWDSLIQTIRKTDDPKTRQEATRFACERIWGGYNGDEEYIPQRVFDPSN